MKLRTIEFTIKGLRPLLMNNGIMSDRLNPYQKEIDSINKTKSKAKTDAQWARYEELQWLGGLYWSDAQGGVAMPCDNLRACMVEGARKSKLGKQFEAAVFFEDEDGTVEVRHKLTGATKDQLRANPLYTLRKPVVIGMAKVVRIRPMIPTGWTMRLKVTFDDSVIRNASDVIDAWVQAGTLIGIGDWRPRFGRFVVEDGWKEVA